MIVNVRIGESADAKTIKIPCGDGRQTFKWLANVVQTRIREFGILRAGFDDENYIVVEIRNADDELINPVDALYEHASNTASITKATTLDVTAVITNAFPVDTWEIPEMNSWLRAAYLRSKVGVYWEGEMSAWRESLAALNENKGAATNNNNILSPRIQRSSVIKIGYDFSQLDIDAAFDLDWKCMRKWKWPVFAERKSRAATAASRAGSGSRNSNNRREKSAGGFGDSKLEMGDVYDDYYSGGGGGVGGVYGSSYLDEDEGNDGEGGEGKFAEGKGAEGKETEGAQGAGVLSVSESELSLLGDAMKNQYSIICNVFAHYCGIGTVGERYGMSVQEFAHLLHFLRIYNCSSKATGLALTQDRIEDIFVKTSNSSLASSSSHRAIDFSNNKSNRSSRTELAGPASQTHKSLSGQKSNKSIGIQAVNQPKWPLMTRAHLAQALVCVALTEKMGVTPVLAFNALLQGPLERFWGDITSSYLYYTVSAEDPSLKATTQEYYPLLRQMFNTIAGADATFGPQMGVSSLISLLLESTMIEPEHESICVVSFLKAQLNPPVAWELENMVLAEFLEAVSRVALTVLELKGVLTDAKKIRMAYNFITELLAGQTTTAAAPVDLENNNNNNNNNNNKKIADNDAESRPTSSVSQVYRK